MDKNEEETKLFIYNELKQTNFSSLYKANNYVDYFYHNSWSIGKIISIINNNLQLKYIFHNNSHTKVYDEVVPMTNVNKVSFLRHHTSYTTNFPFAQKEISTKGINKLLSQIKSLKSFLKNTEVEPYTIISNFRGLFYYSIKLILSYSFEYDMDSHEQQIAALFTILKEGVDFIIEYFTYVQQKTNWLRLIDTYNYEKQKNKYLFLVDKDLAIVSCYKEMLLILEDIFLLSFVNNSNNTSSNKDIPLFYKENYKLINQIIKKTNHIYTDHHKERKCKKDFYNTTKDYKYEIELNIIQSAFIDYFENHKGFDILTNIITKSQNVSPECVWDFLYIIKMSYYFLDEETQQINNRKKQLIDYLYGYIKSLDENKIRRQIQKTLSNDVIVKLLNYCTSFQDTQSKRINTEELFIYYWMNSLNCNIIEGKIETMKKINTAFVAKQEGKQGLLRNIELPDLCYLLKKNNFIDFIINDSIHEEVFKSSLHIITTMYICVYKGKSVLKEDMNTIMDWIWEH